MSREEIAKKQVVFEKLAKDNGYLIDRLKRSPLYYQDSHTEAAFQGWLGIHESTPNADNKEVKR